MAIGSVFSNQRGFHFNTPLQFYRHLSFHLKQELLFILRILQSQIVEGNVDSPLQGLLQWSSLTPSIYFLIFNCSWTKYGYKKPVQRKFMQGILAITRIEIYIVFYFVGNHHCWVLHLTCGDLNIWCSCKMNFSFEFYNIKETQLLKYPLWSVSKVKTWFWVVMKWTYFLT